MNSQQQNQPMQPTQPIMQQMKSKYEIPLKNHYYFDTTTHPIEEICEATNNLECLSAEFKYTLLSRLRKRYSANTDATVYGQIAAPTHESEDDESMLSMIIGMGGYYLKQTTTTCDVDLIWHDRENNRFMFWGPSISNVANAMDKIRQRIIKYFEQATRPQAQQPQMQAQQPQMQAQQPQMQAQQPQMQAQQPQQAQQQQAQQQQAPQMQAPPPLCRNVSIIHELVEEEQPDVYRNWLFRHWEQQAPEEQQEQAKQQVQAKQQEQAKQQAQAKHQEQAPEEPQPLRRSNAISSADMWTSEPLAYYKAIDITEEEQFISAVDDVEDFEHDGITYDREYGTNWLYQADYETKMWELVGKWVPEHNWILPVNVVLNR